MESQRTSVEASDMLFDVLVFVDSDLLLVVFLRVFSLGGLVVVLEQNSTVASPHEVCVCVLSLCLIVS